MSEVPIPLTDQEIDTDDGAKSILVTLGMVILGFATLAWSQDVGTVLANKVNSTIADVTGYDPASGDSADDGVPGV